MVDFFIISTKSTKNGGIEIFPKFIVKKSSDLMIRGGDFYAIWLEEEKRWSTDEQDVMRIIDQELDAYADKNKSRFGENHIRILHMWDSDSGVIDKWHKYVQKQCRDNFHMLDENIIFSNTKVEKEDYSSKKLSYPLSKGDYSAWDKLVGTLYSEEERKKIEWAIGSIVSGDSKYIQKFLVFYGEAGTGKSTVLNVIEKLFDGYCAAFDAKVLGSSSNSFALEAFKKNPLVAIQHDGDLSRIEDNTRLNSLVSHESMTVNNKFEKLYSTSFHSFLFMGTNKPVKITDSRSGLLRRLIDVSPTGEKVPVREYNRLVKEIDFELGAIAKHCLDVYKSDPGMFDDYIPVSMLGASNDFYNFVVENYYEFRDMDAITLKAAWERYKQYCDETNEQYPIKYRIFREEFKTYWSNFDERKILDDGTRVRCYYSEFRTERFETHRGKKATIKEEEKSWIIFSDHPVSVFDVVCADSPAQLATEDEGIPMYKWSNCKTTLKDIDTKKLHYVKVPTNHIVIDFDIPDDDGKKCLAKNLEEAAKWPPTYAELSKSGEGIHLHYIYTGDVDRLAEKVMDHVEIKVFKGNASLRRKLSLCTANAIATICSGLPLRKERKLATNVDIVKDESKLRMMIKKNLDKEFHGDTSSSINFINKLLDDAYEANMSYDVSDMYNALIAFAQGSHNQAMRCIKVVNNMHLKGKPNEQEDSDRKVKDRQNKDGEIIFFDVEVFPNLFIICWKSHDGTNKVNKMINPTPEQVEELLKFKLVGFNCRRYDNHILYGRLMGYSNEKLYKLSQKLISKDGKNAYFGEAYNLSYTDIYDFANGDNKTSLKKLEIVMGIHHDELGLPWDEAVPEWAQLMNDHYIPAEEPDDKASVDPKIINLWDRVAEYCCNDVIATEKAFDYLKADWVARQILADVTGLTVNDTSNTLTTKLIFGNEKNTQHELAWRDMGDMSQAVESDVPEVYDKEWTVFDAYGRPIFPGYKFDKGQSTYRGENPSEGGYVYAEPGMYGNVALLDIASMHPSSILAEELFGKYTENYSNLVNCRLDIKHQNWDEVNKMFGGKLEKYVEKVKNGEMSSKQLANAIKIPINSVYGLTSAGFSNPFKHEKNVDNIVAKRGALFMINLKHEVQRKGFKVAHIKTDSIKIPDATPEIIEFVMEYGKLYGYTFEHEATYDRMCLVNDAVYIAKYADGDHEYVLSTGEKLTTPWTATGTEFKVPYIFKTLFSKHPTVFDDYCMTQGVKSALYLDMNEDLPDVTSFENDFKKLAKKYKEGKISDTTWDEEAPKLYDEIAKGHNYIFIGKVGQFVPVKEGCGGGLLMREQNGKYYNAANASGYRWKNAEVVRSMKLEDQVDTSYWENMAHDAIGDIMMYGDYNWFVSDSNYVCPEYIQGQDMAYPDPTFYDPNYILNPPEVAEEELPWTEE
ncbi:MAG: hypothetical protein J6Y02_01105 [Pseudobutyrivibrio sp.]|nr:hypothetical protein [Pseudobutyrivibrio sp.]